MVRKKPKNSRAQRLKQNARVRSQQVAQNAISQIDTINPTTVSRGTVKRLTRPQLERLALNVGRSFNDVQYAARQYAESHAFIEHPPVTASKKDRLFAARTLPSAEQIASAPPRQAKLLRQQVRKINAARGRVEAEKQFNADLLAGKTVTEKSKDWEEAGVSHIDRIHDADQHFSTDLSHALRYQNVLTDPEMVKKLSTEDLLKEIKYRTRDVKIAGEVHRSAPSIAELDDSYVVRRLRAAFGNSAVSSWKQLSKSDRYALLNQTSFLNRIEFYSVYNDEIHGYESWDHEDKDKAQQERNDVMAFMRHANKIAGLKTE